VAYKTFFRCFSPAGSFRSAELFQACTEPLSNMAMKMVLRRMKIDDSTVRGFRSSYRDWAGNSFAAFCPQ
jgi:hypothetical protein